MPLIKFDMMNFHAINSTNTMFKKIQNVTSNIHDNATACDRTGQLPVISPWVGCEPNVFY